MLLHFREKYQIPYAYFLKNNSQRAYLNKVVDLNTAALSNIERAYLNKVVDLNTAALSNMIMKFFIKKI